MSWRLVYYVMLGQGRRGEPRVFLSNSVGSLGIGVRRGKHFPREFPESARWDGGGGLWLVGVEADDGLFEFAGEFEGHFLGVVFGDWGTGVFAAVEGFVEGETEGESAVDAA